MNQNQCEKLPFYHLLTASQQKEVLGQSVVSRLAKDDTLSYNSEHCGGPMLVLSGRARVYISSAKGATITLYRLLEGDICVLSAACMINSLETEIHMQFEEDCQMMTLPKKLYQALTEQNREVERFFSRLLAQRLSDVMWILGQFVFENTASRLASALIEHGALSHDGKIRVTHEKLAADVGTAREVITRLLKQFCDEGLTMQKRGIIEITDFQRLKNCKKGNYFFICDFVTYIFTIIEYTVNKSKRSQKNGSKKFNLT